MHKTTFSMKYMHITIHFFFLLLPPNEIIFIVIDGIILSDVAALHATVMLCWAVFELWGAVIEIGFSSHYMICVATMTLWSQYTV